MKPYNTFTPKPIDYSAIIAKYSRYWHYFAVSVFICLLIALIYNKLVKPVFKVSAQVLINEQSNFGQQTGTEAINAFGLFDVHNSFQNQILILNSVPLVFATIQEMGLEVTYLRKDYLSKVDLYNNSPILITADSLTPKPVNALFRVQFVDKNRFRLKCKGQDVKVYDYNEQKTLYTLDRINLDKEYNIGETVEIGETSFKISIRPGYFDKDYEEHTYYFQFNNMKALAQKFKSKLVIEPIGREVTVADVSMKTENIEKGNDFINQLITNFIKRGLQQKNHLAINTIDYIDRQLEDISDSLRLTENQLQSFKSQYQVLSPSDASGRSFAKLEELESEKAALTIQLKYYEYLKKYMTESDDMTDIIVPSSMGIVDPVFNGLIQELTTLVAEKQTLIANNQTKSPYLAKLNIRIENLKKTTIENVNYMINTTTLGISDLDERLGKVNREIYALPKTESKLYGIERRFNLNDAVYTYLLERRAEAQIAKASNLPDNEFLEYADATSTFPVAPKKKLNLLIALFLGLFLPVSFFRIKELFYNKFYSLAEFEEVIDGNLLGNVYHNRRNTDLVFKKYPGSSVSECFRSLRTNLDFILGDERKIVLITSSVAMEGKSFISLNLASSYALTGKKVALVGFDLRKPKQYEDIGFIHGKGVTNYLLAGTSLQDLGRPTPIEGLYYYFAGTVPPNPLELIASDRTKTFFEYLKEKYDCIFIDSPPLAAVSDSLVLAKYCDVFIYVVRRNYVPKMIFNRAINKLNTKVSIPVSFIFNDDIAENSKYGYGYYEEKAVTAESEKTNRSKPGDK